MHLNYDFKTFDTPTLLHAAIYIFSWLPVFVQKLIRKSQKCICINVLHVIKNNKKTKLYVKSD